MKQATSRENVLKAIVVIVAILTGLFGALVLVTDDEPVHRPHDWKAL